MLVRRIAKTRLRNAADADDVFQEVFVSLYCSQTSFLDEEHLRNWLIRATVNRCKNVRRFQGRHPEIPQDPMLCEQDTSGAAFSGCGQNLFYDDSNWIWELVDLLSEPLQTVVRMYYVEGYSTDEIAKAEKVSPATVRTRLKRAREKLHAMIEEKRGGRQDG